MEYFVENVDTATGEVTKVSLGNWVTVTELGRQLGAGPKQTRTILLQLGFMSIEGEGRGNHRRHRVSQWVVRRGWAKRLELGKFPFDVLAPQAQDWIVANWPAAAGTDDGVNYHTEAGRQAMVSLGSRNPTNDMTTASKVAWLLDNHPNLMQAEMARCLGVTQPLISRYKAAWRKRLCRPMALTDLHISPQGCATIL